MPGFGYSDSLPRNVTRNVEDWGKDVEHVLIKENITGPFYSMGVSAGSMHAISLLAHFPPARVLGGILLAPTTPTDVDDEIKVYDYIAPETRIMRQLLEMYGIGDLLAYLMSTVSMETRFRLGAPDVYAAMQRMKTEGESHARLATLVIDDGDRGTIHTYRGWTDNARTLNGWKTSSMNLKQIKNRVLVATSEDDMTNPSVMAKWIAKQFPNSELVIVPDGYGHMATMLPMNLELLLVKIFSEME